MKTYRYEKKFLVDRENYSILKKYLLLSSHNFQITYPERKVFSIYYDTTDLNFYRSNVAGDASRIKIRARQYPTDQKNDNFILELKCKQGEVGYKNNHQFILNDNLELDLSTRYTLIDDDLNIVLAKHIVGALIPAVAILYTREYYLSANQKIRLTVDRDLLYGPPSKQHHQLSRLSELHHAYVVEVKYNAQDAALLNQFAEDFPFRQEKNSKYVKAYSALHGIMQ